TQLSVPPPDTRFEGYFLQVLPGAPPDGGARRTTAIEIARRVVAEALEGRWNVTPFWSAAADGGPVPPGDFFVPPAPPAEVATPAAWTGLYKLRQQRDVVYAEPMFELALPRRPRRVLRAAGGGEAVLPGAERG